MRLDQLKERWLPNLHGKQKKKKNVLHRISFKAVTRSTRLASHPGLTLWIQHGDWGGGVYFSLKWLHAQEVTSSHLPFMSTRLSLLTSALVNICLSSESLRFSPQLRITLFRSSNVINPSLSASKRRKAWRSSSSPLFCFVWDIMTRNSLKSMCPLPENGITVVS